MKSALRYFAAHVRPGIVFPLLRAAHGKGPLNRFVNLWDPNVLRRSINAPLPEKRLRLDFDTFSLWVNVNDHIGFHTYLRKEPFEQAVYHVAKKLKLTSEDIILDVGANIGTASVPICAELGCELIAVEASKGNADLLLKNLYENRVKARVHLVALVDETNGEGFAPLFVREGNTGANSLKSAWSPSLKDPEPELVPVDTLDNLLDDETIDRVGLIKIDVEGAEAEVLKGARHLLKRSRAPILMEYRVDATQRYLGADMQEVLQVFEGTHEVFGLSGHADYVDFDPASSYENIVIVPKQL